LQRAPHFAARDLGRQHAAALGSRRQKDVFLLAVARNQLKPVSIRHQTDSDLPNAAHAPIFGIGTPLAPRVKRGRR